MFDRSWQRQGACFQMGGTLFDEDTWHRPALEICRDCPVKRECADDALSRKTASDCGVWGFTSLSQRERLRQRQTDLDTVWKHNANRIDREVAREQEQLAQTSLFDELADMPERLSKVDRLFVYVGA